MEAKEMARAGSPVTEGPRARLLRGPLFWAAVAAFLGAWIGLFGTLRQATLRDAFYLDPLGQLLARVPGFAGEALVMSSALGVAYLLWNVLGGMGRRVAVWGMVPLAALLLAEAVGIASSVYWSTGQRWQEYAHFPFPALEAAASHAIYFLPPAALLPFAALALAGRERGFGILLSCLLILSLPFGAIRFWLFSPGPDAYAGVSSEVFFYLVGWYSAGVSLLEAPLWILLGVMLARRANAQALGEAFRVREKENLKAARRLYERGLGRGELHVLDGLVREDFRDLRRGSRGTLAMERVFSALWKSYPDLTISIKGQEAEDDLVRTRLVLSGTDEGGVLWYPPTGRRATFAAEFVDRFSEGKLIEHSGEADTEALLGQLGLTETRASPGADR
jgi:predicted ester cyclase